MAWVYLVIGGILEVGWALGLDYSDGFTKIEVVIPTVILFILSFFLLCENVKDVASINCLCRFYRTWSVWNSANWHGFIR